MTDKKRPAFLRLTTPAGTAGFNYLNEPDTKFSEVGNYRTEIVLDPTEDTNDLLAKLEAEAEKSLKKATAQVAAEAKTKGVKPKAVKAADLPVSYLEDGRVKLNIKCPAKITLKSGEVIDLKPVIFDGRGNRVEGTLKMASGSTIKVNFEVRPFYTALVGAGISLRLRGVQVLKLVEYGGGGSADSFGFGDEGGYEGPEDDDAPFAPDDATPAGDFVDDGSSDF